MSFAGYGGWGYMRPAAGGHAPRFSLRRYPLAVNGFLVPGGDVAEVAELLREAVFAVREGGERYTALRAPGRATAVAYSFASQRDETAAIFL